jgi:hypothetical protein
MGKNVPRDSDGLDTVLARGFSTVCRLSIHLPVTSDSPACHPDAHLWDSQDGVRFLHPPDWMGSGTVSVSLMAVI